MGNRIWCKINIMAPTIRKVNFYTSMYHAFISPVQYMDVDGNYRGLDYNIHKAEGFTNYTTFSLWDTYRALHPLFTLLQPSRDADMINPILHITSPERPSYSSCLVSFWQ